MRWIQHRRRQVLRQRIASGEVDLEALGIKRITVPQEHLNNFPLFIYIADPNWPESSASSHSMGEHRKGQPQQDNRKSSENVEALRSEKDERSHGLPSVGQDHQDLGGIQLHDLQHRELSFAQYTCPICLDEFVSHKTALRELPCGHAFHPGCVDSFLTDSSSLCPMCKKSVLPRGYCPPKITNVMVRRERIIRRMRERVVVEDDGAHPFNPTHRRPSILRAGLGWPTSPQPVRIARTASTIARPGQRSEEEPVGAGMSTVSVPISSVPEENSEARRAWARRRANAMLGISRTVEEEEQEAAARTPACKLFFLPVLVNEMVASNDLHRAKGARGSVSRVPLNHCYIGEKAMHIVHSQAFKHVSYAIRVVWMGLWGHGIMGAWRHGGISRRRVQSWCARGFLARRWQAYWGTALVFHALFPARRWVFG